MKRRGALARARRQLSPGHDDAMVAFVQMARRSKPWERRACAQMLRDLGDVIEGIIRQSERDQQHDAERGRRQQKRRDQCEQRLT
jgi:hypothetical protein